MSGLKEKALCTLGRRTNDPMSFALNDQKEIKSISFHKFWDCRTMHSELPAQVLGEELR